MGLAYRVKSNTMRIIIIINQKRGPQVAGERHYQRGSVTKHSFLPQIQSLHHDGIFRKNIGEQTSQTRSLRARDTAAGVEPWGCSGD